METIQTIWTWFITTANLVAIVWTWYITTANLVAIVLAIFAANYLRNRILDIKQNWESAVMPSIAFLLLHLGIYWIEPVFWVNWFNSKGFIVMQVLVVVGFYTASLKTKPAGVIGLGLVLVGFVGVGLGVWTTLKTTYPTYWATTSTKEAAEATTPQTRSTTPSPIVFPEIPQDNPVAVATDKFWRENLHPRDAAEMIAIAEKESAFSQFEADGTTPYRGRINTKDVGVMQINESLWLAKAKELDYNIYDPVGNLKMALWIRERYGARAWVSRDIVGAEPLPLQGREVVIVSAPTDSRTRISTPGPFSVRAEGPISIRTSDGSVLKSYRDAKFELGRTDFVEFQSRAPEGVIKVTVSR